MIKIKAQKIIEAFEAFEKLHKLMNELLRIFHYLYLKCTLENEINCDRRKKRVPDMLPFDVSHTFLQNPTNYFLEGFLHSDNNQKDKIKFLDNCCFLNANMDGGR